MAHKSAVCVFYDRTKKTSSSCRVSLPTGGTPSGNALKIRCNDIAYDEGYSHWAQPDMLEGAKRWLVFQCRGRSNRLFLGEKPTQEAAEMWLVHLG